MFCGFDLCSDIPNTGISHLAKTTAALTTATLPARANLVMLHHCPLK